MRIRRTIRWGAVAAVVFLTACAGGKGKGTEPKTPAQPLATGGQAQVQTRPAAPPFDLSPVPAPADIVLRGRMGFSPQDVSKAQKWIGAIPMESVAQELFVQPELGKQIRLDAPIYLLATLAQGPDPKVHVAYSLGIHSFDQTADIIQSHVDEQMQDELPAGAMAYAITRNGKSTYCVLSPSVGEANTRLTCSNKRESVLALYPYIIRTLPNDTFGLGHLMYIDLDFAPVRTKFGAQFPMLVRTGMAFVDNMIESDIVEDLEESGSGVGKSRKAGGEKLSTALKDATAAVGDELVGLFQDLDHVTFVADRDPQWNNVKVKASIRFRGQESWIGQQLANSAGKVAPPPEMFWQLPKDVDSASYWSTAEMSSREKIQGVLEHMIEGAFQAQGVPTRLARRSKKILGALLRGSTSGVSARHEDFGVGISGSRSDVGNAAASLLSGWYVTGVDEAPKRLDGLFRELSSLYNDPFVRKALNKALDEESGGKKQANKPHLPKLRYGVRAARGLPRLKALQISTDWSFLSERERGELPAFLGSEKGFQYYVLLWPHDGKTWMAAGSNVAKLEEVLRTVRDKKPEATLAGRQDLQPLRQMRANSAGFYTLWGLMASEMYGLDDTMGKKGAAKMMLSFWNSSAPNKGKTPMFVHAKVSRQGSGTEYAVVLDVPQGTLDDLAGFVGAINTVMNH